MSFEISRQMMNDDQLTWGYAGSIIGKDAGKREVYGIVSGPKEDLDMQGCDPEWLKTAIPEWFKRGNIRQMHSGSMPPAGKAQKLVVDTDTNEWYTSAKIVNDDAWKMVDEGIYTGFSVGIKNPVISKSSQFKNGLIAGGQIIEVSLVDFPAYKNSTITTDPSRFTILKRASSGALEQVAEFKGIGSLREFKDEMRRKMVEAEFMAKQAEANDWIQYRKFETNKGDK